MWQTQPVLHGTWLEILERAWGSFLFNLYAFIVLIAVLLSFAAIMWILIGIRARLFDFDMSKRNLKGEEEDKS